MLEADEDEVAFERQFDRWLQMTGLDRVELATLLNRSRRGMGAAEMARAAVLWLYGPAPGRRVPQLLLAFIEEYTETVGQQACSGMKYSKELRRVTDALIESAAATCPSDRPEHATAYDPFERLTDRERQILRLIGSAMSNRRIATTLRISEKTVKNHITSLFAKLGVTDRTAALVVALHKGLLTEAPIPNPRPHWSHGSPVRRLPPGAMRSGQPG